MTENDDLSVDTLHAILERYNALDNPPADKVVLLTVYELGSPDRTELMEHTGLAYSTVHRSIERLEDGGQVTATVDMDSRMKSKRFELVSHDEQDRAHTPVWERETA